MQRPPVAEQIALELGDGARRKLPSHPRIQVALDHAPEGNGRPRPGLGLFRLGIETRFRPAQDLRGQTPCPVRRRRLAFAEGDPPRSRSHAVLRDPDGGAAGPQPEAEPAQLLVPVERPRRGAQQESEVLGSGSSVIQSCQGVARLITERRDHIRTGCRARFPWRMRERMAR